MNYRYQTVFDKNPLIGMVHLLPVSDEVIVGSSLKFDGDVNKRMDAERAAKLVESLNG